MLVDEFSESRVGDFTHDPLTPVDRKHAATRVRLKRAIEALGGKAAIQASGAFGQQTEEKRTLRQNIEDEMRNYNRTAASIAEESKNPGLMDCFRMPQGSGDGELKAVARAFAAAIREMGLNAEFAAHGHSDEEENGQPIAPDAVLDRMADDFETNEGEQGHALSTQAGATSVIPVHLREGKSAVKTLDAIYGNVYRNNAEMLGAWKTASHVERRSVSKAAKPTATTTPTVATAPSPTRVAVAA